MWPLAKARNVKKGKSAGRRGTKQARSLKRRRRVSLFLRGSSLVMLGLGIIASVYIWQTGLFHQWLTEAGDSLDRDVANAGFAVGEVRITGQKNTGLKQIRAALALYDGQSMTSLDLQAMLGRIEDLPWVKMATITRIMPDILQVTIVEHQAAALWQEEGQFHLINRAGLVITDRGLEKYAALPQIVGPGANQHLGDILAMKQKHPELFSRVTSWIWVGRRRWDIVCHNGIRIKLPEAGPDLAWEKLYRYERDQKILDREILIVDLRQPDKMIVRLSPAEAERRRLMMKSGKKEESI